MTGQAEGTEEKNQVITIKSLICVQKVVDLNADPLRNRPARIAPLNHVRGRFFAAHDLLQSAIVTQNRVEAAEEPKDADEEQTYKGEEVQQRHQLVAPGRPLGLEILRRRALRRRGRLRPSHVGGVRSEYVGERGVGGLIAVRWRRSHGHGRCPWPLLADVAACALRYLSQSAVAAAWCRFPYAAVSFIAERIRLVVGIVSDPHHALWQAFLVRIQV
ncbi:hypothetical protein PoMZ_03983 [Pyricularia oryzae]|uniref:Uncharacterized protein n=1 Tax=Pyricularia oryzae TaxID=318829 RepID=A0A4P7N940_PYROR|nr:hypothetical protein PoMZ_03983 [Pyricularia oryzae]